MKRLGQVNWAVAELLLAVDAVRLVGQCELAGGRFKVTETDVARVRDAKVRVFRGNRW